MKLKYEDLLSGDSIYITGVGHIRSPFLKEIRPTQGIGFEVYNFYLSVLSWDKESFLDFIRKSDGRSYSVFNDEKLTVFDVMILHGKSRKVLNSVLEFFLIETVEWNEKFHSFVAIEKETGDVIGVINRDNFEDVRDMMLQMNYINLDKKTAVSHSTKHSQEMWEFVQKKLKEQAAQKKPDENIRLGNVISKLSACGCGYTLLNIYELTIFQLYDQFFQYGYLKATHLNERAFTIHGGDKFDMQEWLKPIFKK